MLSNGGDSSPDFWILLTIIFIALISILLNPIVFRHNFRKKTSSIARRIYMALSAVDFLASIALGTMFSYTILPPKEEQCIKDYNRTFCDTHYFKYARPARITEKAMSSIGWSLTIISMSITSTLAVSRWFQISHPLRILSLKAVKTAVAGSGILIALIKTSAIFIESPEKPTLFKVNMQGASSTANKGILGYIILALAVLICSFSAAASLLTVWNILRSKVAQGNEEKRRKRIKSSLKVFLLNIGNVIWIGVIGFRLLIDRKSDAYLALQSLTSLLSLLQSSYNPIIYVSLTRSILTHKATQTVSNVFKLSLDYIHTVPRSWLNLFLIHESQVSTVQTRTIALA